MPELDLTVHSHQSTTVTVVTIVVDGQLVADTYKRLQNYVIRAITEEKTEFVLDLAGVDDFDEAGISGLINLHNELAANNSKLLLKHPTPRIQAVFTAGEMTGLLHLEV